MKRMAFIVLILVLWLATYNAPPPEISAPGVENPQIEISISEVVSQR